MAKGDKSAGTCVIVENEASCTYKGKDGKPQGEPLKYAVLDLGKVQVWNSPSGSIKVLLDFERKRYYYGQTYLALERGAILNKQCIGKIEE